MSAKNKDTDCVVKRDTLYPLTIERCFMVMQEVIGCLFICGGIKGSGIIKNNEVFSSFI